LHEDHFKCDLYGKRLQVPGFILVSRLLQLRERREAIYSGRYMRLQPESDPGRVDSTLGALIGVSEKVMCYYTSLRRYSYEHAI
jgi:hypothetical protein